MTDIRGFIKERGGSCKAYAAPFAVNLFSDDTTFVEPDLSVVCDRNKLSDRGCEGAPDFVVEVVSPSNPGMDYVTKLGLYHAAGVGEYWICDPVRERTVVYRASDDFVPAIYPFDADLSPTVLGGPVFNLRAIVDAM